jgi:hypothetical protein
MAMRNIPFKICLVGCGGIAYIFCYSAIEEYEQDLWAYVNEM